jgi:Type IV secretion-system coupling protein DNA-binding domain
MTNPNKVIYFAETDARNSRIRFGIKQKDRSRHVYVIGKTGMGKSTLLENMAAQDIQDGNGMCFIDPHGKTAELLLEYIPKERMNDVLYFAPFDMEHPISFNIMEDVGYDKRHLVVSGLMSAFKKIWKDAWSARMEYILSNTLFALLEYPDATLLSVNRMLSDKAFRKKVVDNIQDTAVKSFWVDEFANYTERMAAEAVPAIQNKVGQFTSNPLIRNIIGQPKSSFDLREMMDNKKIIIVNLSKGRMGESNAQLLGSLLVTKIYLAAMSRADQGPHEIDLLPDFSLFVDEFQSFANESFADILSEARKYKLNLHIAHQYVEQMPEEVRAAVFGNVGTLVAFRVGSADAELFEKEFAPTFMQQDIVNLGFAQVYMRLMIDGIGSKPFSARTLPPLALPEDNSTVEVIAASRRQFSRSRVEVEEQVKALTNMGRPDENTNRNGGDKNNSRSGRGQNDQQSKPQHRQSDSSTHHSTSSSRHSHIERNDTRVVHDEKKSRPQYTQEVHVDLTQGKTKTEYSSKPVISKDKEFELKKQLQEAQKRAIDESVEDATEEFFSLKTIYQKPGQKDISKENKNALKDALLKVLQQNGAPAQSSHVEITKKDVKQTHTETVKIDTEPTKEHKPTPQEFGEELKKQKQNHDSIRPGEIPEDELKKLLEVE